MGQDFNASGLANMLWAKTDSQLPDAFETLGAEAPRKMQNFEANETANTH